MKPVCLFFSHFRHLTISDGVVRTVLLKRRPLIKRRKQGTSQPALSEKSCQPQSAFHLPLKWAAQKKKITKKERACKLSLDNNDVDDVDDDDDDDVPIKRCVQKPFAPPSVFFFCFSFPLCFLVWNSSSFSLLFASLMWVLFCHQFFSDFLNVSLSDFLANFELNGGHLVVSILVRFLMLVLGRDEGQFRLRVWWTTRSIPSLGEEEKR